VFRLALSEHPKGVISLQNYVSLFYSGSGFTMWVQWLYTSIFNAIGPWECILSYRLGSQLGAVGFKNQAIHKLYDMNLLFCTIEAILARSIFDMDVGSGLRRLAVDSIALGFLTHELDINAEEWKMALKLKNVWSEVMSSMARQYTQTWKSNAPEKYYEGLSGVDLSCAARGPLAARGVPGTADFKAYLLESQ